MKILPEKEEIRSEKVTFHAEKELKNLINYPESHKFHQFSIRTPQFFFRSLATKLKIPQKNYKIRLKKINSKKKFKKNKEKCPLIE